MSGKQETENGGALGPHLDHVWLMEQLQKLAARKPTDFSRADLRQKLQENRKELESEVDLFAQALDLLDRQSIPFLWSKVPSFAQKHVITHLLNEPASSAKQVRDVLCATSPSSVWESLLKSPTVAKNDDLLHAIAQNLVDKDQGSDFTTFIKFGKAVVRNQPVYSQILTSLVELQDRGIGTQELRKLVFGISARKQPSCSLSSTKSVKFLLNLVKPAIPKKDQASYNPSFEDEIAYLLRCASEDVREELLKEQFFKQLTLRNWLFILDEKHTRSAVNRPNIRRVVSGYIANSADSANSESEFIDFLRIPSQFRENLINQARSLLDRAKSKSATLKVLVTHDASEEAQKVLQDDLDSLTIDKKGLKSEVDRLTAQLQEAMIERDDALEVARLHRVGQHKAVANKDNSVKFTTIQSLCGVLSLAFRVLAPLDSPDKQVAVSQLSDALEVVKIQIIGLPEEIVTIDGRYHDRNTPGSARRGIVAEPGFKWVVDGEEKIVKKALIVPIEE